MATLDLGNMSIADIRQSNNADIMCLSAHIDLALQHLQDCPSANQTELHGADIRIMVGVVQRLRRFYDIFSAEPAQYMPNSHPHPMEMPTTPTIQIVRNPIIQKFMTELVSFRNQMLKSDDNERQNSFHKSMQSETMIPWFEKQGKFLVAVAEGEEPANAIESFLPDADLSDTGSAR